jgi:hypothetical protein
VVLFEGVGPDPRRGLHNVSTAKLRREGLHTGTAYPHVRVCFPVYELSVIFLAIGAVGRTEVSMTQQSLIAPGSAHSVSEAVTS